MAKLVEMDKRYNLLLMKFEEQVGVTKEIEKEVRQIKENELTRLDAEIIGVRQDIIALKQRSSANVTDADLQSQLINNQAVLREVQDRAARRNNLMFYNVSENKSSDLKVRVDHDNNSNILLINNNNAETAYVDRHNVALRVLYYHLRHSYGIDETPVLPYAPGDIESVVENERCRIYWNYSFPTLELSPAEVNIVSKGKERRTKYQELLGQLRRLWPDYVVSLLVMVIGSLGGMRNTLLSALRAMPVYLASAHILAARMQKAVIFGQSEVAQALLYVFVKPQRRVFKNLTVRSESKPYSWISRRLFTLWTTKSSWSNYKL
nr:unnamed protein product [Callosobruchus chinensis]